MGRGVRSKTRGVERELDRGSGGEFLAEGVGFGFEGFLAVFVHGGYRSVFVVIGGVF